MTGWLIRHCIKDSERVEDQAVRTRYGTLGSGVGIGVNLLLSLVKFLAGTFTGSVAITADAANNLSDAAGSIVSLVSVRMAQKPVDREHPFGHGRVEYLGALGVGVLILLMGFELLKSSVEGILHPALPTFGTLPFAMLILSIFMKLWLYFFYRKLGKAADLATLLAASKDSLSDVMATSAVALSMLAGRFLGWAVDGWMGAAVALLVLKAGFEVCRDTVNSLVGGQPDRALGQKIIAILKRHPEILGVHDLMIHDYGPGRCIASVHAEVAAHGDILQLHEVIDQAEQEVGRELNIPICVHMDPIVTGDAETDRAKCFLENALHDFDATLTIHDFRRVPGEKQTNLIFDVALPAGYRDVEEVRHCLESAAKAMDQRNHCIIHFDTDYYQE